MPNKGVYFELFDDELPPVSKFALPNDDLVLDETIRLKCLFALLFGATIRIPEQWAISSPSCLKICSEIIAGYDDYCQIIPHREKVTKPIEFYCFDMGVQTEAPLKTSLLYRLGDSGRRMKIAPALDLDANENAGASREKVINILASSDYVEDTMIDDLVGVFKDKQLVEAFNNVFNYERQYSVSTAYNPQKYLGLLANYAREVEMKNIELSRKTGDLDADQTSYSQALTEFFAFDEYKAGPANFVALWDRAKVTFQPEIASFIEGLGRAGMHNSFARVLSAEDHSASYTLFKPTEKTDLLEYFVGDMYRRSPDAMDKIYSEDIIQSGQSLGESFWKDLWRSVYAIRNDDRFKEFLAQQVEIMMKNNDSDTVFSDGLMSIVDQVNQRLSSAHLALYGDGSGRILGVGLRKGKLVGGLSGVAAAVTSVVGPAAGMTVAGTTALVASLTGLSFYALDAEGFLRRFFRRDIAAGKLERAHMARFTLAQ